MPRKGNFERNSSLTILLFSCGFLLSLLFNLSFSKHGCNEGEEEETYFALRIIHIFVHACEACCGHSKHCFCKANGRNL